MAIRPKGPTAKAWVKEFSNHNSSWEQVVSEWLDNSIGHNATRIDVTWSPKSLEVRDNGVGCTRRMFQALVSPNTHEEDDTVNNRVSVYGIGAKIGFLWCQGETRCFSRRGEECYSIRIDWQSADDWEDFDVAMEGADATKHCDGVGLSEHGVVIRQEHNRKMSARIFEHLQKSLSKRYWAAIETGVEIDVRFVPQGKRKKSIGGLLLGRSLPKFSEFIDEQITLADGRTIRISGGVLANDERLSDPGFEYIYGHRVVVPAGGLGSGGMDFERIYARVYLEGDKDHWRVTTTKDCLHDADLAALEQAVFDRCKPLLEEAGKSDYASLLEQQLLDQASDMLNEANRKKATRKSSGENTGTADATGSGAEHQSTKQPGKKSGKYRAKGEGAQIKIRKAEFDDDSAHLAGKAHVSDRLVRLNTRHCAVQEAFDGRNLLSVYQIAMSLWSDAWTTTDDNGQRRHVPRSDFVTKFSAMLASGVKASAESAA